MFTSLNFDVRSDGNIFSIQEGDNSSNNELFSVAPSETMIQTENSYIYNVFYRS